MVFSLKSLDKFTYLGNSISSTENDINMWLPKAWTAIDRLLIIWKSDLSDKIKHNFFQVAVVSILLYNCTRMLRATLNKSWEQHLTKQQLYGHLPPISKTIHMRWTRHVGHCWRSKDKLISNVLLWNTSHRHANVSRQTRTYLQQLCMDTGCRLEDWLEGMDDRDEWWERIREIRASSRT